MPLNGQLQGVPTSMLSRLLISIGVSIGLFVLLMVLGATGVITPHGIHG